MMTNLKPLIKDSADACKAIKQRLAELDIIEKHPHQESILTMLASEEVLKKDWDNEADERWNDV
ncbi:MAG TPA: hypothetical protein VJC10_02300 [Patescibacteria group bacterium]|nr:hypothetical protein [Patescibacteria group bacterium]